MHSEEVDVLCRSISSCIDLNTAELCDEFFYYSLPLCVIDSVFSIGVNYESVKNAVKRYCAFQHLPQFRCRNELPDKSSQQSCSNFVQLCQRLGPDQMAEEVFKNRQRTSSRSGILKSEAACLFAQRLVVHGVEHLQDVEKCVDNPAIEKAVRAVKGQASGISWQYFLMLAGNDNVIKPDRMVLRFLSTALNRPVRVSEAPHLLQLAAAELAHQKPNITARLIDYQIWLHQRDQ